MFRLGVELQLLCEVIISKSSNQSRHRGEREAAILLFLHSVVDRWTGVWCVKGEGGKQ